MHAVLRAGGAMSTASVKARPGIRHPAETARQEARERGTRVGLSHLRPWPPRPLGVEYGPPTPALALALGLHTRPRPRTRARTLHSPPHSPGSPSPTATANFIGERPFDGWRREGCDAPGGERWNPPIGAVPRALPSGHRIRTAMRVDNAPRRGRVSATAGGVLG